MIPKRVCPMDVLTPRSPEELAEVLGSTSGPVLLGGRFTKQGMAGPLVSAATSISTSCMQRVLRYEPRDLTISVEAGLPFADLRRILAEHRQMVPLDPPFSDNATVGGVIAANTSGPRRRLYGSARDLVIGMKFATVEGKLVQSGGMVVKNVAGLDMAKLLIGSFGTLAAIAVVNFKLGPIPPFTRTFLLESGSLREAISVRNRILGSVLQPAAIDLLNPHAAALVRRKGWLLAIEAGGNAAVIERYGRELQGAEPLEGIEEEAFWQRIRDFTPAFLTGTPEGAVVRVSCTLAALEEVAGVPDCPVVARAGSGVCWAYFRDCAAASEWMKTTCLPRGWKVVMEFAPPERKPELDLWPNPGADFEIMKKVKDMFDPAHRLNPGRLYGRI
jgi:glycolate oxidase FAD binding subunit